MKRQIYGLLGMVAIAALGAACKDDPLADTGGNLSRIDLEFAYREVIIGDSVRTFAVEKDALNTPLPPTATVRSCNAAIATVLPASDAPTQRTAFFVKGITYGSTCVIAEAGALSDTMQVSTFPASITISGPDSIQSGAVTGFTYTYRDRGGNPVAGVPVPVFTTADTTRAKALAAPLGNVQGRSPGIVRLTVTGTGSPAGGVTAFKNISVVPGTFTGTLTPASGGAGDVVKVTRAGGAPAFDSDTWIAFGAVDTYVDTLATTPDSIKFIVPGFGATGARTFVITGIGPSQVALQGTLTISRADFLDPSDPASDDPATAPTATGNTDLFGVLSGTCTDGVFTDPGDDCDDFFVVSNPLARPDTITVRLDWTQTTAVDVDILWCRTVTCSSVTTGGGATSAKPENSTVIIPANTTWYLWINLFDPAGTSHAVYRARVRGRG